MSDLGRPGAFRVNLAVGRANLPQVDTPVDHSTDDTVLPHPSTQPRMGLIVNPGPRTRDELHRLVHIAHARAVGRHR